MCILPVTHWESLGLLKVRDEHTPSQRSFSCHSQAGMVPLSCGWVSISSFPAPITAINYTAVRLWNLRIRIFPHKKKCQKSDGIEGGRECKR